MPSTISMIATANSMASPTGGGMTTLKAMIRIPTARTVMEWPRPHRPPINVLCTNFRLRDRMVVTAIT